MSIARIRTVHGAHKELKKLDPGTCVSEDKIKQLVRDGIIPHSRSGRRIYINFETLLDWLEHPEQYESQELTHFTKRTAQSVDDIAVRPEMFFEQPATTGGSMENPKAAAYGVRPIIM